MQIKKLIFDLIMNICFLSVGAGLIAKIPGIQSIILEEKRTWKKQVLLSVIFGGIIIVSTAMGIRVGEYNMNTKIIGSMSAGLIGGPVVGLYASLIGSIYVYVFSPLPAFAMASAFSTVLFGLLGGGFYPYFQRGKWKYQELFLLTCFAEVCEMVALLRMTVPVQMALNTVLEISGPMILLNSIGMLIFISSFNTVFVQQDLESSRQLKRASELTKKCLPLLRDGLQGNGNMRQIVSIIMEETEWAGVMITDTSEILAWQGEGLEDRIIDTAAVPDIGKRAMQTGKLITMDQISGKGEGYEKLGNYTLTAAPFVIKDKSIGCVIAAVKQQWVFRKSERELLQHFVMLGASQIAMADLEKQQIMRQRAEFKALQFQVNPHFLFNALNTISCVCRENSDRARELLIVLANYFRYNLNYDAYMIPMEEEMNHVRDYLELEQARFEDKLTVTYDVPERMEIRIPTLILQPIVENAVRHGIDQRGRRIVHIQAVEEAEGFVVRIQDRGRGFPKEVLEKLESGEAIGSSIGLSNVHRRMKSIYGEDHGLKISSSEEGSAVELWFSKEIKEGVAYENRSDR